MSAPSSVRRIPRTLLVLAFVGVIPTLASCQKKPEPVIVDSGPPPAPVETATQLVAMEEDAGTFADADADAKPGFKGPAVNPNIARLKQCCAALSAQGKSSANTPEGQMVINAGNQCAAAATHLGPNGTAPEFAVIRGLLVGKTVPAVCAGLF